MKKIDLLCMIDDDLVYTFLLRKIIEKAEVAEKLIFFKNGLEALDYLKANEGNTDNLPAIILLDINMPILDGWQFMDGFADLYPSLVKNITIYMTSSSYEDEDYNRAMSTKHVEDFVRKPVQVKVLRELIDKLDE